jgi:hypothetical protein
VNKQIFNGAEKKAVVPRKENDASNTMIEGKLEL